MKTNEKISIVVTRYDEANSLIHPCLIGLSKQKNIMASVYFLDQKKDKETEKLCKNLTNKNIKIIYKKIPIKSLSYARNLGIKLAKTKLVLFIDSDAIPLNNKWALELTKTFNDSKKIAIVGGKSVPKWIIKPKWYHKSNILMDIYSIFNLGKNTKETDRIVGVNFGLNKKLLKKQAFFDETLGRRPGTLFGDEESDLCKRSREKDFKVFYNGKSIVEHQIQENRMNLIWVMRRFYYGGYGKAILGGAPKTYTNKRNIYDKLVLIVVVIPYIVGFLRSKIKNAKFKH